VQRRIDEYWNAYKCICLLRIRHKKSTSLLVTLAMVKVDNIFTEKTTVEICVGLDS
jgi:hypothetical protein